MSDGWLDDLKIFSLPVESGIVSPSNNGIDRCPLPFHDYIHPPLTSLGPPPEDELVDTNGLGGARPTAVMQSNATVMIFQEEQDRRFQPFIEVS